MRRSSQVWALDHLQVAAELVDNKQKGSTPTSQSLSLEVMKMR